MATIVNFFFILVILLIPVTVAITPEIKNLAFGLVLLSEVLILETLFWKTRFLFLHRGIIFLSVLLIMYYIFHLIVLSYNYSAVKILFQIILCIITFLTTSLIRVTKYTLKYIRRVTIISMVLGIGLIFNMNMQIINIKLNPNFIGTYFFVLTPLVFLTSDAYKKYSTIVFVFINTLIIVLSGSRAALFAQLIMIILLITPVIAIKKHIFYVLLPCFYLFIKAYIYLNTSPLGKSLNDLSQAYFSKNFFSGRQEIWSNLLNLIYEKPFLGYGSGTSLGTILNINLSAHNWYLQIIFQTGLIGLFLLIAIIFLIYRIFTRRICIFQYSVLIAFVPALLVQEMFEVMLTQNNLTIGLITWTILGLGVNRSCAVIWSANEKDSCTH